MKKKVLFVINTMGAGGAERCLVNMLHRMNPEKEDIYLYAILPYGELFAQLPDYVHVINKQHASTSVMDKAAKRNFMKRTIRAFFHKGNGFKDLKFMAKTFIYQLKTKNLDIPKIIWKIFSDSAPAMKREYDVAVAYIQGAATYYVADKVKAKRKVTFMHNEFFETGYHPQLHYPYYKKFDQIYCVSKSIKDHFDEQYPECESKTKVFYNIVDDKQILRMAKEPIASKYQQKLFSEERKSFLFLTAARLYKVKAYDIAIEALNIVRKKGYDACWYVLGEGEEREALEKQIKKCHLEHYFKLLGAVSNPYQYMIKCDCYVQATHYEGCCTSISEAVILQKPVLASDCDGNHEQLIRYQIGKLVTLTAENLADAMIDIMKNGIEKPKGDVIQKINGDYAHMIAEMLGDDIS